MTDKSIQSMEEFERSVEDLYHSFPSTFRKDPYVSVSIGWHGLIADFCSELEPILNRWKPDKENTDSFFDNERPYLNSIKEKYGQLRLHVCGSFSTEDLSLVEDLIKKYQNKSLKVCESCGRPGSLTKKGWILVSCGRH